MQARKPGRLYGVGVGPGDPDLVTLKAVRVLRRVPAVLVPHSTNRPSVALDIVKRWLRARQRLILQPYPMMGSEDALAQAREEAADQALSLLSAGTDLAFVTEGDPLLFSTFIDLLERTCRTLPDLHVEVIPAVSSITACAAAAGVPLARRAERIAVLPVTDGLDDLEAVLDRFDTVVLLKVRSAYAALVERLDRLGLTEAAVLVEDCGRPDQRITRDLRSRVGQPLSYFATVLLCRTRRPADVMSKSGNRPPPVSFIGAGPGAPDLITVRGRQRLACADLVLYADSLVHPGLLRSAKAGAEVRGTAAMTLEEIVQLMVAAARAGKHIARVHSGDPSLYGAIHEQMARLAEAGIAYEVVPGVSAVSAAAASLGMELTRPGIAQTVILTRAGGRTGMPAGEALEKLARHGTTLVLYLSAARLSAAVRELRAGGYPADTPVVVVYRASWEDERILRGALATIAGRVRAAKLTRQALILVGQVFGDEGATKARSRLYDPSFSHLFRNRSTRAKGRG